MKLAALALVTTLGLAGTAGTAGADPVRSAGGRPRGQFHQLLLERFDANHDGQLDPQERHRAARVLRRMARKLAMDRGPGRAHARRDRNANGFAAPGAQPPGAQPPGAQPPGAPQSFDQGDDGNP